MFHTRTLEALAERKFHNGTIYRHGRHPLRLENRVLREQSRDDALALMLRDFMEDIHAGAPGHTWT